MTLKAQIYLKELKMAFKSTVPVEIRFADLDAYGHVNSAKFITYLETARTKLFLGRFSALMHSGIIFLVAKVECEYKKPLMLKPSVLVDVEAVKIGNSSFELGYTVHNGEGEIYAAAKTVMVTFDKNAGKPVRVPDDMKRIFEQEGEAPGDAG